MQMRGDDHFFGEGGCVLLNQLRNLDRMQVVILTCVLALLADGAVGRDAKRLGSH